jgi:ubiquinone/menaquinone biosynthesis C-methylase UbiE
MTATITFDNEMARLQHAVTTCYDSLLRRTAVIQALNPRRDEQILEVGCGGGFYATEVARCVGDSGRLCAIDISADQINFAREQCAGMDWVDIRQESVLDMSYEDGQFDAVYSVQVIEYVASVDDALRQIARVLKPGGRAIIYDTNWSSVVWYSRQPERMKRMLAAWNEHCPYPDLPTTLAARLRSAGLLPLHQQPASLLNMSFHPNSYSYWAAQFVKQYVVGRGLAEEGEADGWAREFDELEAEGAYFFCYTPVLTEAIKVE